MVIIEDIQTDVKKVTTPVKDFVGKYFTKTTLIMSLAVLTAVSIYTTVSVRSKYQAAKSELEASRSLYSIVTDEKARLDSLVDFYKHSIDLRDAVITIQAKKITEKDTEIASLRKGLSDALSQASTGTASESYKYINLRVPAIAPKIYPFDSLQVKKIHYTFLERDGYLKISVGLDSLVKDLKQLSFTKDNQIGELKSLNNVYLSENDICAKEKSAYQTEIKGLNKEVKREKVQKTVSNIGILGLVAVIVAIIL